MQTKKVELQEDIYRIAVQEFLHKGYDATSMRSIAKKANTSIGNIYHYYASKEALFDEMISVAIHDAKILLQKHLSLKLRVSSVEQLDEALAILGGDSSFDGMEAILRPEFVIFIKQDHPKYQAFKEEFLHMFRQHLAWHLHEQNPDDYFIRIIANMFIESVVFIVKTNKKREEAIAEFVRLFRMICTGLIHKE